MATKKELRIVHKYNCSLYELEFVGGGELPDMLKSKYTSVKEAERMRDLYYAGKLPKRPVMIQPSEEVNKAKGK